MVKSRRITLEEVRHMAALSRLVLSEAEEETFREQFSQILAHMDCLAQVDTTGVEPLYSPIPEDATTRQDVAHNERTREQILANAPETNGEAFVVPRIV